MTTTLQALLGVEHPIIQAPMAGSQGSALALSVCAAGGLGSLAAATLTPAALRAELEVLRERSPGPWNVNFFCHRPPASDPAREAGWLRALDPHYHRAGLTRPVGSAVAARAPFDEPMAELLAEFRPPVVSFHFGLPSPALLARVKSWGARVLSSATTVDEALWLQDHGADAVIAQGLEAGGHRGMFLSDDLSMQQGLFTLLPQVVRAVRLPVIAAGGIVDAAGVTAAQFLGAAGVQVGTAYLLCPEAQTAPLHRAALLSPAAGHTALTNIFTGRPARGIVNRAMRELGQADAGMTPLAPAFPLAGWALGPLRAQAESEGRDDYTPLWAGQGAPLARPMAAADLTRALARGWRP
jgi:nitronate monooxygenase